MKFYPATMSTFMNSHSNTSIIIREKWTDRICIWNMSDCSSIDCVELNMDLHF